MPELPEIVALERFLAEHAVGAVVGRIDVAALNVAEFDSANDPRFIPLTVNVLMVGPGGATLQVTTVRLVPKVVE